MPGPSHCVPTTNAAKHLPGRNTHFVFHSPNTGGRSGVAHKERGNQHSALTNNLSRLQIDNASWIQKSGEDTGPTAAPKTGDTDRRGQAATAYRSGGPRAETAAGTSARAETRKDRGRRERTPSWVGGAGYGEVHLQELNQFPQSVREKNSLLPAKVKG